MKRIIYDYENPHIVGRAKHAFSLGKLIVLILVIALVVALIYIFFFRKPSCKKYESKEYFTVVVGEYESESQAKNAAAVLKARGGAGYISKGSSYVVIASVYGSEDEAKTVAGRYGYSVAGTGEFKVGIPDEYVKFCFLPEKLFEELSNASVSLDKGEISQAAALALVNKLIERVEEYRSELKKSYEDKLCTQIEAMYDEISASLSAVSDSITVKFCLIDITFIYKSFLNSLS